jgi:hypothetical protein
MLDFANLHLDSTSMPSVATKDTEIMIQFEIRIL